MTGLVRLVTQHFDQDGCAQIVPKVEKKIELDEVAKEKRKFLKKLKKEAEKKAAKEAKEQAKLAKKEAKARRNTVRLDVVVRL